MSETFSKLSLAVGLFLFVAFIVVGIAFRFLIYPVMQGEVIGGTSSGSQYDHTITLRLDSFSGYAGLRAPAFHDRMREVGVKVEIVDDKADYADRIRALKRGKAQMAVFTIDAYVKAGVDLGEFPGSIFLVLDETYGADAIVAYKDAVPNLAALDQDGAKLVLTPDSPSEFLARVAVAEFGMKKLSTRWTQADGSGDVLKKLKKGKRTDKTGYVVWEPDKSRALQQSGTHVLFDSSQLSGYIVDVLVVERQYLLDHPDKVKSVAEAYLRTLYEAEKSPEGLAKLVQADDSSLDAVQANAVVNGIRWRNSLENYAHFGLVPRKQARGILHLEDSITNITMVLQRTGSISANPIEGKVNTLFFDGVLREMKDGEFHPGKGLGIAGGGLGTADLESARGVDDLPSLSDDQWDRLSPAGAMEVKPIQFGRGGAKLNVQSQRELSDLARRLHSLPNFYLTITGNTRSDGDAEANRVLAEKRAGAAMIFLTGKGISSKRMRSKALAAAGQGGGAQSVSFVLSQPSY